MPTSPRSSGIRPASTSVHDRLRPYVFHGVQLSVRGTHAVGDCLFCGREDKFSVEVATGLWRCWTCGGGTERGGGNGLGFVRLLYERASGANVGGPNGLKAFQAGVAADRRLLSPAAVAAWGICPAADGTWLVPGYGVDSKLDQVYRRIRIQDKGEWVWRLLPTPGIWPEGKVHALHLPIGNFDLARSNIFVCEGPWDGMALWEVWNGVTGPNTNIVAVPGCNVWRDEWTEMCRGKTITLMYDSDHPPTLGGYNGMKRVAKRLSGIAASVRYINWGDGGFDPSKPSGYDVRDFLTEE